MAGGVMPRGVEAGLDFDLETDIWICLRAVVADWTNGDTETKLSARLPAVTYLFFSLPSNTIDLHALFPSKEGQEARERSRKSRRTRRRCLLDEGCEEKHKRIRHGGPGFDNVHGINGSGTTLWFWFWSGYWRWWFDSLDDRRPWSAPPGRNRSRRPTATTGNSAEAVKRCDSCEADVSSTDECVCLAYRSDIDVDTEHTRSSGLLNDDRGALQWLPNR
ncbi:hypothetical protein OG21DRAFT_1573304 [Imleria badia]|nr:hypothetical protein OG21DRAFT_1573304 [Imleria badia]